MKNTSETLARELFEVIPLAIHHIREELRRHRGSDLTIPQYRTLLFLQRNPGAALRQLADHLGLTPPTVSKMITGLLGRGLIIRPGSTIDRRRVELRLTAHGNTHLDRVRSETIAHFAVRLERLPAGEREKNLAALDSLYKVLLLNADEVVALRSGSAPAKPEEAA
jgi:DNA-binding MarR family transcriptional regulator